MSDGIITKKAIVTATKELTRKKPFDKISVSDIANACGLNRQTFYYHFQDKYELLSWIYYNEAFLPIMEGISFSNWDKKIYQLFDLMKREKTFYINTIKYAENYFQEYLMKMTEALFCEAIEVLDDQNELDSSERVLISRFYAYGVCGTVVAWAEGGMKMEPAELAENMRRLAVTSEYAASKYMISENLESNERNESSHEDQ